MDINTVNLVGRLTADANLSYSNSGTALLKFSIAVDHRKDKNGNSETSFFTCKSFGKIGENIAGYMQKGKQVAIEGYLKQDRWESNGEKKSMMIVYCNQIQLIGSKSQNSNASGQSGYEQQNAGYGNDYGN